jgi:predicted molibdopterin-dependent oxidoreductase YjgC
MQNALPFNRLETTTSEWVTVFIEDKAVMVREGDSVAAAVLIAGLTATRTTAISESKRAPYCLMGVCYECLLTIDGKENTQACMTQVRDGMKIYKQYKAPQLSKSNASKEEQAL